VSTDPAFLRRILQNLLSNALRYAAPRAAGPRVLLGCRRVTLEEGGDARAVVLDLDAQALAPSSSCDAPAASSTRGRRPSARP